MKLNKVHLLVASVVFLVIGYFTSSTTIEIISAVSGLMCVWLSAKESIWSYPIGFVNIGAFMYIFWGAGLYADFTLQIVFSILSVYGWAYWLLNRGGKPVRPTQRMSISEIIVYGILVIAGTFAWAEINIYLFDNPSIPYLDAFIAMLSVVAQMLLSTKRLENWYVWIAVDVISVGMYWYKDLHIVAILYAFFLVNAVYGLLAWKKEYNKNNVKVSENIIASSNAIN